MAQFTPGHLHIEREALSKDDYSYNYCVDYEVILDPAEGKGMQFRLHGTIQGKAVDEKFFLAKDQAFDFARSINNIAKHHGIPAKAGITSIHGMFYDEMFEDVRNQLGVKSGDPVKDEHLV